MSVLKIKAYLIIGFALFIFKPIFSQDQRLADSLISILNKNEPKISKRLELLRGIAFNFTNPDSTLFYADKLISLAKSNSDYINMSHGYYLKGDALRQKGKPGDALKTFFECAKIAEKINYKKGLGVAYSAIGDAYATSKNHQNSVMYYKKAIRILRETNDSMTLASALLNLGVNYIDFNRPDSAMNYLSEAENLFTSLNYELGTAYCSGNKGRAELKQKKIEAATNNLLVATKILAKYNDNYPIAAFSLSLSNCYQKKYDFVKAKEYAKNALIISLKEGFNVQVRDAYFELSEISLATGDYLNAFNYQSKYYTYRDSINNNESIRKMADLRTEYEVAQKQTEVDYLMKKREAQRIIVTILIVAVILFGTLLFVLYINYKKKQELNRILQEQKEELMSQQEQLAELNTTKDRFFSIISHDLRGPIGTIGNFPMLIDEYIAINRIDEIAIMSKFMDTAVKRVSFLLDNLLEWAVSQQGTFPYHPETIHVNKVMEEIYSVFSLAAENKGVELIEEIHGDVYVYADKNSLMTIFRNLLNNAIKFTNQGGHIILSAYSAHQHAVIKVKDTGVGMSEEKLKTLFELKQNKSTWGTDREKGLGIGLTLVYEFVRMNNGRIDVESAENTGSVFTVRLPANKEESEIKE